MYRRRRLGWGSALVLLALVVILGTGSSASSAGQAVDASYFNPGSCIAFGPTGGNRDETVFLDAGHGGLDPGSVGRTANGSTIYEADETLPVELDTMAILRREGFRVVVSRTRDTSVIRLTRRDVAENALTVQGVHEDVAARDVCANDAHATVLIGIYFDAGGPDNAGSITGYDAVRRFAGENLRLAELVQTDVLDAMNAHGWAIPNQGVQPDNELGSATSSKAISYGHLLLLGPADPGWFNSPSEMPGALIEPLFITDPFEGSIAASSLGQHVIAAGLAKAVEQYFARWPDARGAKAHHDAIVGLLRTENSRSTPPAATMTSA